jgi:hypothetical protein
MHSFLAAAAVLAASLATACVHGASPATVAVAPAGPEIDAVDAALLADLMPLPVAMDTLLPQPPMPHIDIGDALSPAPTITPRGDLLPRYMLAPRQ